MESVNFVVSERAVQKALTLRQEAGYDDSVPLRIGIKGGGCAGYEHVLLFENEDKPSENDFILTFNGLTVVIDQISATYLDGTELDFIDNGLLGSGFKFVSAAIKSTCGCGKSFSM